MSRSGWHGARHVMLVGALAVSATVEAQPSSIRLQCPNDTNGDGRVTAADGAPKPGVVCRHLAAGDGFLRMADGKTLYSFGFSEIPLDVADPNEVMDRGTLAANLPAPTLSVRAGEELYLTLTNVGMVMRPDLVRPAFGALPRVPAGGCRLRRRPRELDHREHGREPYLLLQGQRPRHLHVPLPRRGHRAHADGHARQPVRAGASGWLRRRRIPAPPESPQDSYAYNDGDGSTRFDVEYPIQMASLDPVFHDASFKVQPLPFADMRDQYFVLNGRGYPGHLVAGTLPPPANNPLGEPLDQPAKPLAAGQLPDQRRPPARRSCCASRISASPTTARWARSASRCRWSPGTRACCAAGRQQPVLRDQLRHAGRRGVGGRHPRHDRTARDLLPVHDQPASPGNAGQNFGGQMTHIVVN